MLILYGFEISSLTFREECRLRVFDNRVLRVFRSKRDEVTGEWRKSHNEELRDLYSLPSYLQDKNTAFGMWKKTTDVSEENCTSICGELMPWTPTTSFSETGSLSTELFNVTYGSFKEKVKYFCLKQQLSEEQNCCVQNSLVFVRLALYRTAPNLVSIAWLQQNKTSSVEISELRNELSAYRWSR